MKKLLFCLALAGCATDSESEPTCIEPNVTFNRETAQQVDGDEDACNALLIYELGEYVWSWDHNECSLTSRIIELDANAETYEMYAECVVYDDGPDCTATYWFADGTMCVYEF